MDDDYYVRYGDNNGYVDRTFYDNKENTLKEYDNLKLSEKITWKELIHEPLNQEEEQIIIKSDEAETITIGKTKYVVHDKNLNVVTKNQE